MATKGLGLAIGLLVGLVALGFAYSRWSRSEREKAHELNAELGRLRAQVGQLASAQERAGALSMLRDAAAELRTAAASPSTDSTTTENALPNAEATHPTLTAEQVLEKQKQHNIERIRVIAAQLDEQLAQDGHDRQSTETITASATSVVDASQSGRVQRVDCATSLCRIRVTHASLDEQHQLGARISRQPPFNEGDVIYQYDEAALTTTLYMSRAGTTLTSFLNEQM